MRYILLILFILIPYFSGAQSIGSASGSASVLLLRRDLSPRAAALSGAFTAIADDETALLYNPAGLVNVNHSVLGVALSPGFEKVQFSHLVFTYNFDQKLGWAIGVGHMGMPEIQGKDVYGDPTKKLNAASTYLQLGIGYKLHKLFSLGMAIKYFNDQLADYSANGLAVDFGGYLKTGVPGLTAGISVQNLATEYQYDVAKENIPMVTRAGIAFRAPALRQLIVDFDVVKASDLDWHAVLGAEYNYRDLLFARLGNRFYSGQWFKPTIGLGIRISRMYEFNYSFAQHNTLGSTHWIGFAFRFNRPSGYKKYISEQPTEAPPLRAPGWIKYKVSSDAVELEWEKVPSARYNVYARQKGQKELKKITPHQLYANTYKFKGLKNISKLIVAVTALRGTEESAFSKEVTIEKK